MTKERKESAFEGPSRIALVEGLYRIYQQLGDDKGIKGSCMPVWVSLEAPSGWGKTRVGLELYRRLAAKEQHDVAYWPDKIIDADLERKATRPRDFVRPPHSLPSYLWLGITCSQRGWLPSEAWREDIQQLECHIIFLEAQYRALTAVGKRVGRALLEKRREIARVNMDELASQAVDALGLAFPGIVIAKKALTSTGRNVKKRLEDKSEIAKETQLSIPPKSSEVDKVVAYLARISQNGIRVVLLVEDIHRADDMVFEFIDKLMQLNDSAVLIISTTWPEKIAESDALATLFQEYSGDEHPGRLYRVTDEVSSPRSTLPDGDLIFPDGAGLKELEKDARLAILRESYELVDDDTAAIVLERYVSPLALEEFCKINKWHRHFPDGDLRLTPENAEELPDDLIGIYSELWHQMSLAEKATLAVAWFLSPENINAVEAPGERRWSHAVLRDIIPRLTLSGEDHDEIAGALDADAPLGAWIRAIDEYLRAFVEPLHSQVVEERGHTLLRNILIDDVRDQILRALAEQLKDTRDETTSTSLAINRARAVLALYRECYIDDLQVVAEAIDTLLGKLVDNAREFTERGRLWELYLELDHDAVSLDVQFSIRRKQAAKLVEEQLSRKASEMYDALLNDMIESSDLGLDHPETLDVCLELMGSDWYMGGDSGRNALIKIVRTMRSRRTDDDPVRLKAEMHLAWDFDDVSLYRRSLQGLTAALGRDDPAVLAARRAFVSLHNNVQDFDSAIAECDDLLRDMDQVFESPYIDKLEMKKQKASLLEHADKIDDAIKCSREVVEDMSRRLDSDDPSVLEAWFEARNDLIHILLRAEHAPEAFAESEKLVDDTTRLFGPNHPISRNAEHRRIEALIELDRVDEAINASEELLSLALNSQGADDLMGSYARNWHVFTLWNAGRYDASIAAYRDQLEHESRLKGNRHFSIFNMRSEIIGMLNDAGHATQALAEAESGKLVDDATNEFGPQHEMTSRFVQQKKELQSGQSQ